MTVRPLTPPDFGLYFFGDYPQQDTAADAYETLLAAARFADHHDFSSVWLPERHFHSFGGVFPNPSVLAAAVAAQTTRIRINAGSVVLPLHDPIRVAEEWSVVDNLSGGRVGIGCASGWNSNDFVFFPDRFGRHRELMYQQVEDVRRLWRGRPVTRTGGTGQPVDVSLFPRPLQPKVPMYTAVVGRRESFAQAARNDLGIITNLMTQDIPALADNIAYYRRVRGESGLDPASGTVTVLLHTYLAADAETARQAAFEPLTRYMRASLSLFGQVTNSLGFNIDLAEASEEDLSYLFGRAYGRYCESRALIGSADSCAATVDALTTAGVDEIASLVDFGMPPDLLLAGLPQLELLRSRSVEVPVRVPMSPGQQAMWVQEELAPGNNAQNEPKAIRLEGRVDHPALERALVRLVARHKALRTVYRTVDGEPEQTVLPRMPTRLEVSDHRGRDESEVVSEVIGQESRRAFSLEHGPLFAVRLLTIAEDRHVLVMCLHHIMVDALSVGILTRDLSELYRLEVTGHAARLPPLSRHPVTTATGTDDRIRTDLDYWREQLAGELPVLRMPADRPRPPRQTYQARGHFTELNPDLTSRLRDLGDAAGATVFMTLLAGLAATLRRFTGQDDLIVGVPVSSRTTDQRDAVGLLLNTVALRFDTSGDPSFHELLRRVRGTALDAYDHATVPFETMVAEISPPRDLSHTPVYQVTAEYKSGEAFELNLPGVTATALDAGREVTATDLMIHLTQRDGRVICHLEYNTDLFDSTTIERFGQYLRLTLADAAADPRRRLSQLGEVTDDDRELLSRWGSGPATRAAETTVVAAIEDRARQAPEATAVVDDTGSVTYRQLSEAAGNLGRRLRVLGVKPGDVVATWLPRSRDLPTALLGIMRTGAAYLPLDPALGPARVDTVIADSRARLILTTASLRDELPPLPDDQRVLLLEDLSGPGDDESPDEGRPQWDDPAYVIYTSGSTGRPKGIVATHRNLAWLCRWFNDRFGFGPGSRAAAVCGQSWDVAVLELWPTLTAGGTVAVSREAVRRDPASLADWLTEVSAQFALLPTALGETVLALPLERQPPLDFMMLGGDLLRVRPPAGLPYELINIYGPAETTVVVTTHSTGVDGPVPVPIGTPIDAVVLRVLDESGRSVPIGVPGELHIGGPCVTAGYLHAPDLTSRRFIPDPVGEPGERLYRSGDLVRWTQDGVLEFRGRTDDQVKIRGFRVEPGETAAVLRRHPGIAEAIVLPQRNRHGDRALAAYVVPLDSAAEESSAHRLREHLLQRLPEYLVPTTWAVLDRLPLNANGKLDRARLPVPQPIGAIAEPVADPAPPDRLRALWADVLDTDVAAVGDASSFFDLGGHSITAMRLLNRVREAFDVEYSITELYRDPTLEAMRAKLSTTVEEPPRRGPISYQQTAVVDGQTRAATTWNIVLYVDLRGELDVDCLQAAVATVTGRHESLRTRFIKDGDDWIQEVLPDTTPDLATLDLTGQTEDETSRRLDQESQRIGAETFDIAQGRLIRFRLLRSAADRWRLVIVVHHAVCDGWAVSTLLSELASAYRLTREGKPVELPPATQSIDYARWQTTAWDAETFQSRLPYWRNRLNDRTLTVEMPRPSGRSSDADMPATFVRHEVPEAFAADVERIASRLGCTPFAIWAAALGILLTKHTGHRRLALGAPYAAREHQAHDSVMAGLAMVSILTIDVDPKGDFETLATELMAGYASTMDEFVPLRRILADLAQERDDVPKVMPTALVYQSSMNLAPDMPGLDTAVTEPPTRMPRRRTSFFVEPGPRQTRFGVVCDSAVYGEDTAATWLSDWQNILAAAVEDPRAPVARWLEET